MGLMWVLLPDQDGKLLPEGAMPPERIHPVMPTVINTFDKDGNTPLSLACMEHHPELVSFLMWQVNGLLLSQGRGRGQMSSGLRCLVDASSSTHLSHSPLGSASAPIGL